MLVNPERVIGAQIARDYRRRREAQAAEQDRVGVIFEDVAAAVENLEVALQRLEVARIDRAGRIVNRVAVASLARRPFEPHVGARLQPGIRIDRVVIGEIGDWRRRVAGSAAAAAIALTTSMYWICGESSRH